ncbi:hypothetical protein BJX64DRAFT_260152 [Aspergillus heterothallicus]
MHYCDLYHHQAMAQTLSISFSVRLSDRPVCPAQRRSSPRAAKMAEFSGAAPHRPRPLFARRRGFFITSLCPTFRESRSSPTGVSAWALSSLFLLLDIGGQFVHTVGFARKLIEQGAYILVD